MNLVFKRLVQFVAVAAVAALLSPFEALAQSFEVSTGTLMAAAMETAGYKAQDQVLTQLESVISSLSVLVYTICLVIAVVSFAFSGNYRYTAWFVIAPALFHFLILNKVVSGGAEWQMGAYKNQEAVEKALEETVNANVSWFFHEYNKLVSSTVQEFIRILSDDKTKRQMKFMKRQQLMDEIFRFDLSEPGITSYVKWTMRECHDWLDASRTVALGKRDQTFLGSPAYQAAWKLMTTAASQPRISMPVDNFGPRRYLESLLKDLNTLRTSSGSDYNTFKSGIGGQCIVDADIANYQSRLNNPLSCEKLWCWMGVGIYEQVDQKLAHKASRLAASDIDSATYRQILQDIESKLHVCTPSNQYADGCARDEHGNIISPVADPDDPSLLPVIIGGHIMRKMLTTDTRSEMMSQFGNHAGVKNMPFNFNLKMSPEQRQEVVRRLKAHQKAESERTEVFAMAMTLPYIQGVLLYGLALFFPFFAILILIPTKIGAFFQWMVLWLWVKSWDVGWMFVMILDDILWELMPSNSKYDILADPNHGPQSVFEQAFQGDPTYSLAFYYTMIGLIIVGVPMVTAQAVLGGKKAMVGMLVDGLKGMGQTLGNSMAAWHAVDQAYQLDYLREATKSRYVTSAIMKEVAATKKAAEERRKAEEAKKAAEEDRGFWGWAAVVGGGLLVGAAVLATGGAALVVVGAVAVAGAGTVAVAAAQHTEATKEIRLANGEIANINVANAKMHMYNSGKLESVMMLDEVRAGATGRGEWWNMADAATDALATLENAVADKDRQAEVIDGESGGKTTRAILQAVTRNPFI